MTLGWAGWKASSTFRGFCSRALSTLFSKTGVASSVDLRAVTDVSLDGVAPVAGVVVVEALPAVDGAVESVPGVVGEEGISAGHDSSSIGS